MHTYNKSLILVTMLTLLSSCVRMNTDLCMNGGKGNSGEVKEEVQEEQVQQQDSKTVTDLNAALSTLSLSSSEGSGDSEQKSVKSLVAAMNQKDSFKELDQKLITQLIDFVKEGGADTLIQLRELKESHKEGIVRYYYNNPNTIESLPFSRFVVISMSNVDPKDISPSCVPVATVYEEGGSIKMSVDFQAQACFPGSN